jgi:hypothetical protein
LENLPLAVAITGLGMVLVAAFTLRASRNHFSAKIALAPAQRNLAV